MFDEVRRLNKRHTIKLALSSLVAIVIVFAVMGITVTSQKRSQFCITCHTNISFDIACKKSLSKDTLCSKCHLHKTDGFGQINSEALMDVEIRDEYCTTESCHPLSKLEAKPVEFKKITPFQHKTHIGKYAQNFKVRCTSCHANLGKERHFELDAKTCNICHFIDTPKPLYTHDKKLISDCTLCHSHIEKTKKIYGKVFNHTSYEKNEKVRCSDCHFKTIQGQGRVYKKSCNQCHLKAVDGFDNSSKMHYIHIVKDKTACASCHTPITHGWIKGNNKAYEEDSYLPLKDAAYRVQNMIMMGTGGKGIKGAPDPMYVATLNCSACHKDTLFTKVIPQVCNNCHGSGFDKILHEQKLFVSSRMNILKALITKAEKYQNPDTDYIVQEAKANYRLIERDGSFGAHNIKYIKDILGYSIKQLIHIARQNPDM
ncbi:MAG: Cytochrome c family protein [Candidatus Jettenia ecosi]|uniref:Cytochrome c family protein n=1 Tax=Candidatus Jettenia ecosi TaxID=2494326 RepID=A0A533QDX2_9BACT|nr:MAG: Cytochrome c family protein [Candidatus Jettenia ecosi]